MTAKKYRLETILVIRERAREDAARSVAGRLRQLADAESELQRRQTVLQKCYEQQNLAQEKLKNELDKGTLARHVVAHHNFLNDLKLQEEQLLESVEQQKKNVSKAEIELEKARDQLIEAARELKAIETHKSHWQAGEKKIETKRDQKISDEIGSILHGKNKFLN